MARDRIVFIVFMDLHVYLSYIYQVINSSYILRFLCNGFHVNAHMKECTFITQHISMFLCKPHS